MGEIAINPIHNVHKKYRTMNFVNPYIFAPPVDLSTNTEIGGVAATISTPALLATNLNIDVSRITNFSIVGSDIKCRITGSYATPISAFYLSPLTYYTDSDNLVTHIGNTCFSTTTQLKYIQLNGVTSVGSYIAFNSLIEEIILPNCTSVAVDGFNTSPIQKVYIPSCLNLGGTVLNNNVFSRTPTNLKIYTHPSLAINNSGNPDGDLIGRDVRYVTNFIVPLTPTSTNIGDIYNRYIKLIDTGSSANAIDYFEVTVNGVYKGNVKVGNYISGLEPNTSYNITLKAVDVFYNKSVVSNNLSVSTNTTTLVPITGLISYYKLDETSGAVVNDSYGSEHLTNTGVSINQSGKIETSYLSTSVTNKLNTTSATSITGNFTINCWVFRTASNTDGATIFQQGNNTSIGFGLYVWSDSRLYIRINGSITTITTSSTPLNTWMMLTAVYNGSNLKFYSNGILIQTTAFTTNPTASNIRSMFYNSVQFYGKLDETSIYNTAITQTEIDILYNSGIGTTL